MKLLRALGFCLIASTARAFEVEDFFDRLDNTLTIAAFEDNLRARLSARSTLKHIISNNQPLDSSTAISTISSMRA